MKDYVIVIVMGNTPIGWAVANSISELMDQCDTYDQYSTRDICSALKNFVGGRDHESISLGKHSIADGTFLLVSKRINIA